MLKLRPYESCDADKIAAWCADKTAFYKWSAGLLGGFPLSAERLEQELSKMSENGRFYALTAVDESGAVGFFIVRQPDDDEKELRFGFVIVSPEVRGKCYGKQMLRLGIDFAFNCCGAEKVSLGVFENNPSAYHCYKAVGLSENGQTAVYDLCGEKWNCIELEMRKNV